MQLTAADRKAAREGFKFLVVVGNVRKAYVTTLAEAKQEAGARGRIVPLSSMSYAAANPSSGAKQQPFYLTDGRDLVPVGKYAKRESARKKANNMVARDLELRGMRLVSEEEVQAGMQHNPTAHGAGQVAGKYAKKGARAVGRGAKAAAKGVGRFFKGAYAGFKAANPRISYAEVGKYAKSVDPEMVKHMRRNGYKTDAASIGKYIASVDPEMFQRILANMGG